MSAHIDERAAGRLEGSGARALTLLGGASDADTGGTAESTGGARPPDDADATRLAALMQIGTSIDPAAAAALAAEIVARARDAVTRLADGASATTLSDDDAIALESVIHVRGRPALRVFDNRVESLGHYPGAELWQTFIADYEDRIVAAAAATGAALVTVENSGYPPWVQGSAWLIARDRVVTNRHVLRSAAITLIEPAGPGSAMRLRPGHAIAIDFAGDDRTPAATIRRRVTGVLYVSQDADPVDIAVLAIEPIGDRGPLTLAQATAAPPRNLYVVGHPAPMAGVPDAVNAVFGKPDGRKRVSFGKSLDATADMGVLVHDASTIGGYSGGPVVGISGGTVAGLHYYGDPASGNLAVAADTIRAHAAFQHWVV